MKTKLTNMLKGKERKKEYHPNGRKQRGTKKPFDEGERGE